MTHTRPHLRRQAGMTLVEVLLVVFIAGLMAGFAIMTLPERESAEDKAVRQMGQAIRDLYDRAALTGEVLGVFSREGQLQVVQWTGMEWQPIALRAPRLPAGIDIEMQGRKRQAADEDGPFLVINPLGLGEPVEVIVRSGIGARALTVTPSGEVVVSAHAD